MNKLFDYTINHKQDLKFISKDSKIKNLYVNCNCEIDGLYCSNIHLSTCASIINCIVDNEIVINNPDKFILIRNSKIDNITINNIGVNDTSIHIEHNIVYSNITLSSFQKQNNNVTIYIYQNEINKKIIINNDNFISSDAAIAITANRFPNFNQESLYAVVPEFIDVKDNYYLDGYNINFINFNKFPNYTGYDRKLLKTYQSYYVLENKFSFKHIAKTKILKVLNIPQYLSFPNDPALQTGCEATACAIALSYILNKQITKNTLASFMKQSEPGTISFWESFIGDIYHDGWGCMSTVSVDAINNYLVTNNLEQEYEVINTTNTPLYELLPFINRGIPVIVWCTMGNNEMMYHKKFGSTKWKINEQNLYWPGNDHSLVIVGYNFATNKIYLADPEVDSTKIRERNLFEFENRFTELYSQSILIIKKNNKQK